MNILVTLPEGRVRNTFIPCFVAKMIENLGHTVWNTGMGQFGAGELREKLKDIDVCITGWGCARLDENVLDGNDSLKLVAHTGGSVASVSSSYLYDKGIKVISGNIFFAESVAESVIAYMLSSLRGIPFFSNEMQAGHWKPDDYYDEGLFDQTVGLVGFGMIARILVGMLQPFRARIKVYDPYLTREVLEEYKDMRVSAASMEEIFSSCKIISLHASLTPETYHMINMNVLKLIPDGALFINTARGKIVDEKALEEVLLNGRFKAVLDVFENEPLPPESRLRGLRNVILMPHMGGPTVDRRKHVTMALVEDINRFFNGEKLRLEISREYAERMTMDYLK